MGFGSPQCLPSGLGILRQSFGKRRGPTLSGRRQCPIRQPGMMAGNREADQLSQLAILRFGNARAGGGMVNLIARAHDPLLKFVRIFSEIVQQSSSTTELSSPKLCGILARRACHSF
jgi:hypothetical protein